MTTTRDRVRNAGASALLERRVRPFAETDVSLTRADDDTEMPKFVGHAAVFDSRTSIGNPYKWGWFEEIAPGAFTKTLAEGDARFLIDHDSRLLVARKSAGDLRLAEDEVGLATDADLDTELSYVRDLVRNLEKRRITGMSFGFYVIRDEWFTEEVETSDGGTIEVEVRRILEIRLLEVSAVTFPAYEDTDAALRSVCEEIRAARHNDSSPKRDGESSAPSEEDTRSTSQAAPSEEDTQPGTRLNANRERELAARYGLRRA